MAKDKKNSQDDFEAWQVAEIKAGLAEADRGEVLTDEEASAIMEAYIKSKAARRFPRRSPKT